MKKALWISGKESVPGFSPLSGALKIAKAVYGEVVQFGENGTYMVIGDSRSELIYNKLMKQANKVLSPDSQIEPIKTL